MKKLLMIFLLAISSAAFGQGSQLSQLDGEWYSNQWKYGYTLTNGVGVATSTNSPNFKVGDRIIFLQQSSDKTFEGTQVYTDGKFYKITVQQQSNDTLFFKGEKNVSWTMTKIGQATALSVAPVTTASSVPQRQSNLPQCQGSFKFDWSSCIGSHYFVEKGIGISGKVERYVGEWKDGKPHGQGIYTLGDGSQHVVEFAAGILVLSDTIISEFNNDVVAQALNYVSGFVIGDVDKTTSILYISTKSKTNLPCTYVRFENFVDSFIKKRDEIDLNKGNPKAIEFFTQGNTYITRVDGLPEFRCNGCNGDRVQRAWALIYKECKGTRKAF